MAVPKFVASTQTLLTSNYTNIKAKLQEGERKIYFYRKRVSKNVVPKYIHRDQVFFFIYSPRSTNIFLECYIEVYSLIELFHSDDYKNYLASFGAFPSDRRLNIFWMNSCLDDIS